MYYDLMSDEENIKILKYMTDITSCNVKIYSGRFFKSF